MEVAQGDLELHCWLFEKTFKSMDLMRGGTHRTRALEANIHRRIVVRNPVLVEWHTFAMFAGPPQNCHWHYVPVLPF